MLLQEVSNRLLDVGIGIPRHVDRHLIEIDRPTHLCDQLTFKSLRLARGGGGSAEGMDNENPLRLRCRGIGREKQDGRSGGDEQKQLRTARRRPSVIVSVHERDVISSIDNMLVKTWEERFPADMGL
jgi:hypothetical protein